MRLGYAGQMPPPSSLRDKIATKCARHSRACFARNDSERVVIVNAFLVHGSDSERVDSRIGAQQGGGIAHDIFDKHRIVISHFGDVFF